MRQIPHRRGSRGFPTGPFRINRNSPQAQGLVGWWSCFGQNRGQVALRDMMGRFNMAAFNTPTIAPSELGPVVLFDDAASEYLEIDSAPVTAPPFTVLAWINADDNTGKYTVACLADKDASAQLWALSIEGTVAGDPISWAAQAPGGGTATTTSGITAGTWHHVCGVEKASNNRAVYLDGGNKGTNATDLSPAGIDRIAIGRECDSGPRRYMSGMILEARIYDRALSDAEVAAQHAVETRWDLLLPETRLWQGFNVLVGGQTLLPTSITSEESFGTPAISTGEVSIVPSGISSLESFGTTQVLPGVVSVTPSGIASLESFGTSIIITGVVAISPSGITSEEAFGTATLLPGAVAVSPSSIITEEAFGTLTISPGLVTVSPSGINSEESFGALVLLLSYQITPTGIESNEAFGTLSLAVGVVMISPSGISSDESFGTAIIVGGASASQLIKLMAELSFSGGLI